MVTEKTMLDIYSADQSLSPRSPKSTDLNSVRKTLKTACDASLDDDDYRPTINDPDSIKELYQPPMRPRRLMNCDDPGDSEAAFNLMDSYESLNPQITQTIKSIANIDVPIADIKYSDIMMTNRKPGDYNSIKL